MTEPVKRKRGRGKGKGNWRTAPGPLTPGGCLGAAARREAHLTLTIALRRKRVLELYVHERTTTMKQVVEMLAAEGITASAKTVATDLHQVLKDLTAATQQDARHLRAMEIARANRADQAVLKLLDGTSSELRLKAHDRLMAGIDRRSKLNALYGDNDAHLYTQEQFLGLIRAVVGGLMDAFAEPEHRERIVNVMKRVSAQIRQPAERVLSGEILTIEPEATA